MSDLQIQGEVVVTAEKAEGAFDRVADKATQMANEVAGAAGKAGQAVDGIGAGAEKSAERFTRSEARMRDAIQKSTQELQLLGKTASEKLEFNIAAKGLDAGKFAPYIAELKQAEAAQRIATGSLDKMGISAAQTAAALRQVPAQFTDIIVSLQAGQAPLTVLLQQGGQLKDMFGGVGNAAKALGGYVVGLISPLTIAAAAAVALAIAYKQGSAEADGYNRAIAMTGNAAGTTAAQLQTMAARISTTVGTQSDAADTLAQLVSTGRVAQENLEQFATTAVQLERTAGVAIKETVKDFAELGKAPVEASKKLNESYGFLTAAVYEQIVALQEQGRVLEAAAVAQQAYDRAMANVAATMQGQLGYIERGWRAVADAAKAGWDAMLNVGRADTLTDKLNAARAALDQRVNTPLAVDNEAMRASRQKGIDSLRQEIALLTEQERVMKRGAEAQALRTQAEKDGIAAAEALQKAQDKGLSKQQQLNKALEDYRKQMADLRAVNPNSERLTPAAVARGEKGIRDQFKETGSAGTGENEVAQIRARTIELERYLELLRTHGAEAEKMTESEKLVIKIQEELKTSITGTARAQKEKALAEAQGQVAVERQVVAEQARIKALKESEAALNSQIDAVRKQASSTLEQAVAQESVNANMGKSKTAVEQATLAQLKLQQAEADSSDRFAPAYVAALTAKTEAQERFVKALQQAEFLQKSQKLDEAGRAAAEETATLELQISLIGRSQVERDKIIAQRQAEVRLAKELAEIEKINLGEGPEAEAKRAELRAKAQANAVVEANNAANKAVLGEWQRTADSINQSLTDALLRGFESGKSFAQNLRDTLVNMFKTLVLRPIISFIINPISGLISGAVSSGLSALGLGGNLLGGGGSILGALGSAGSAVAGWIGSGVGALFGGTAGNAAIAASLGLGTGSAAAAASGAALAGGGSAAGAGLGAFLGANAIPILGGAIAAITMLANATKGETRYGGQFGVAINGEVTNNRRGQTYTYQGQQYDRDFSGGRRDALVNGQAYRLEGDPLSNEQAIRDAVAGTASGINAMLKALGSTATLTQFSAGLETSGKGRGGVFAGGRLSNGASFGESGAGDNYAGTLYEKFSTNSPDFKQALADFALDLKQSTIQALQSVEDIPQSIKDKIKDVDAEALTDEAANALLVAINEQIVGVENFRAALKLMGLEEFADMAFDAASAIAEASGGFDKLQANLASYYENYYTESERTAAKTRQVRDALAEVGLEMPRTREEFRAMVEAALAMGEAGAETVAVLLGVAGAFADITPQVMTLADAFDISADSIKGVLDRALETASSAEEAQANAKQGFEDMIFSSINDAMTSSLSGLIMGAIQPMVDSMVAAATTSSTAMAAGGTTAGAAVAAGGAAGGGAVAAGGAAGGGAVAAGGAAGGSAVAAGGAAAGAIVSSVIDQARASIAAWTAILTDPEIIGMIGTIGDLVGGVAGVAYEAGGAWGGGGGDFVSPGSFSGPASAAQDLQKALESLGESIESEVKRLRGLMVDDSPQNREVLLAQFSIATAQARAGDQDALAKLPELSRAIESASKLTAVNAVDLARTRGWLAGSLEETLKLLGLGSTTTDVVPQILAMPSGSGTGAVNTPAMVMPVSNAGLAGGADSPLLGEIKGLRKDLADWRSDGDRDQEATQVRLLDINRTLGRIEALTAMAG